MTKDMKTCIKEFLQQVEVLEGEEDPEGCGIHREYRLIHELQLKNRRENVFKSDSGKENLTKNRYKDIMPYDDHRVVLNKLEDDEGSDYINASLIKGVKGSGGYIASQGPLASTVNDFWRMIWEKEVEIVFMACRIVELGKESQEDPSCDFTKRVFTVTKGESKRTVIHYHYSGWPDHGIPDDPAHIRDLIALMRQSRKKVEVPIVVHCSAGCGRTGAIIAIDYVWTLLEEGKFDEKFSLYELICNFREHRMSIVQTSDQYALVYKVLKSLCEDWLAKMASHTYVNVELENQYANMGNVSAEPEEHVYEDSNPLMEKVDSSSPPPKPPKFLIQENTNGSYVNVQLSNGLEEQRLSHNSSPPPSPRPVASGDEKVLHKTVIQIGTAAKKKAAPSVPPSTTASSTPDASAMAVQKEVVNLIQSDSATTRVPVFKSISNPGTASQPLARASDGASKKSASIHVMGDSKIMMIPESIPGFKERLPRVQGPVPPPPHWNQT